MALFRRLAKIAAVMLIVFVCGSLAFYHFLRAGNPFIRTLTGADSSTAEQPVTVRVANDTLHDLGGVDPRINCRMCPSGPIPITRFPAGRS